MSGREGTMIDKEYGKFILACDICGHGVKFFDSFDEARDYARENGWVASKKDGEWLNLCPQCMD